MLDTDGKRVYRFGEKGVVRVTQVPAANEYGIGVALQADGEIVVSGWSSSADNHDLIIRRFYGGTLTS